MNDKWLEAINTELMIDHAHDLFRNLRPPGGRGELEQLAIACAYFVRCHAFDVDDLPVFLVESVKNELHCEGVKALI